jgi:F-type H+-transporting ATPase subunit delta
MAELTTIARPYAEAAFELAQAANDLPHWSEMLRLAGAVAADDSMRNALDSPTLDAPAKESLFLSILGDRLNPQGRNFIRVLIEADRISILPQIRELFEVRKHEAEGVAKATIESATTLSDEQVSQLTAALERRFRRKIDASVTINNALIGGARITVGDSVIDGSVQGKLAAMAQQLRS